MFKYIAAFFYINSELVWSELNKLVCESLFPLPKPRQACALSKLGHWPLIPWVEGMLGTCAKQNGLFAQGFIH